MKELEEFGKRICAAVTDPRAQHGVGFATEQRGDGTWIVITGPVMGGEQLTVTLPDNGRGDCTILPGGTR